MKKIALTLVMAICLLGACSRPTEEKIEDKKTTASPDPKLGTRMEEQQKAINRAAEQIKLEEQQKSGVNPTPTPSASPSS